MDERTSELIQMDIDGEISAAEKAELDAGLSADAGARDSMESFRHLARELDSLPRVDPPPLLATNVMRALRARHLERRPHAASGGRAERRRTFLYVGYAAAAGLLLGLLTAPFLMRTDAFRDAVAPGRAAASIGAAEIASWELVDRQSASTPAGDVRLWVRRSGSSIAVEASFPASVGSEAAISWDPSRASLLAFVRDQSSGQPLVEQGRLRAPIERGGSLTLVLAARQIPGPLHVEVDGTRMLSSGPTPESARE